MNFNNFVSKAYSRSKSLRAKAFRKQSLFVALALFVAQPFVTTSCIEPPLKLPAQEVLVDMPVVITEMEVVWDIDIDWKSKWYYGWDEEDIRLWGKVEYPEPTNFEARRYYLGEMPGVLNHTNVDGFTVYGNTFRRTYQFGYYDILLWSNIDSPDQTQVVTIDESDLDEVTATTSVTRGIHVTAENDSALTALYNQPEIFYSAYPRDIYISRDMKDYDYYNEQEKVWVKHINCQLEPLVYIYLVQIILYNNDGRVKGINGDAAISAFANSTSVNTGHTSNTPCMVYFNTRLKRNLEVKGKVADIIGGKLTTFGLCDMDGFNVGSRAQYQGSRTELPNYLYYELIMSNGATQAYRANVTDQCQSQCHGGVITIEIDCNELEVGPPAEEGTGSIFNPTVEDYDELIYEIPL
ncbi:MAG: hypothetical protein Q4B58_07265 [Bacteroidales bacterium]|nr:hypothetical protein [Bacteroidales bacterium]